MRKLSIEGRVWSIGGVLLMTFILILCSRADNHEYIQYLYQTKRIQYLQSQLPGFLGPVQVGRVREILSPTAFKLENDVKIQLMGIDNPLLHGDTQAHQCFAEQMEIYLHNHLLGRKIILRRDRTDWSEGMYLLRYVYLPGWDKHEKETFFTEQMIRDGYGKPFFEGKNVSYEDPFKRVVNKAYKQGKGAWSYCVYQK